MQFNVFTITYLIGSDHTHYTIRPSSQDFSSFVHLDLDRSQSVQSNPVRPFEHHSFPLLLLLHFPTVTSAGGFTVKAGSGSGS